MTRTTRPAKSGEPGRDAAAGRRGVGKELRFVPADSTSAIVFIAVAAVLLYLPGLANGFAYDDVPLIQNDPRVHGLGSILTILQTSYWGDGPLALYRPVTTLSFALDWTISGGSPAWFHFTNSLFHALASVLGFVLLRRFFSRGAAFAGALLFALHPVHTEAVANVVGRADVIAAALVFGAGLSWTSERSRAGARAALTGVLFALAIFTKESALVFPALVLLLDVARGSLRAGAVRDYLRKEALAFATLAIVLALCLGWRYSVLDGWVPGRVDAAFDVTPSAAARVLTALQAWPEYLRLFLFPRTLLADYGPRVLMPATGFTTQALAGGFLLLGAVVAGIVALARGRGRAALSLLWFPIAILPVSNLLIPIGVVLAERTLYLPSFALSVGLACVAGAVGRFLAGRVRTLSLARLALVAVFALLAGRTLVRIPVWESTDSTLTALAVDRPDSFRANWYLARRARGLGDAQLARRQYDRALLLWPHRRTLVIEAASFAVETGSLERARELASYATRTWPDDLAAHKLLAGAALDLGDTATARIAVGAGLRIDPDDELLVRMSAAIAPQNSKMDQ